MGGAHLLPVCKQLLGLLLWDGSRAAGRKSQHKWVSSSEGPPPSFWHPAGVGSPRQQEEQGAALQNTPCCLQSTFIHNQKITYHTITQARTAQPQAPSLQPQCYSPSQPKLCPGRGEPQPGELGPSPSHGMLHPHPAQSSALCVARGTRARCQCVSPPPPNPGSPCPAVPHPTPPHTTGCQRMVPHPCAHSPPSPSSAGVGGLYSMAVCSPGPGALVLWCRAGQAVGSPALPG